MKIYFTIFCFLFVFSASSQISKWKAFESPANGQHLSNITQLGNKLIITQLHSIPNSSVIAAIFTYVWDGVKWDTIPYLPMENVGVNSPFSPIFYKNQICYYMSYNAMLVNNKYEHFAIWNGASWEAIDFSAYDPNAVLFSIADSSNIYALGYKLSGQKLELKLHKYSDTTWTFINLPSSSYVITPQFMTSYKGQLFFLGAEMVGSQSVNKIYRVTGTQVDSVYTEDSTNILDGYLKVVGNHLFIFDIWGKEIYEFDGNIFIKTNSENIPINSFDFDLNGFFEYNGEIIGTNYNGQTAERSSIRLNADKWFQQTDILDSGLQTNWGVYSYNNKIIAGCYDSIFPLTGKPSQYLAYIDSLVVLKGKTFYDWDSNCIVSNGDMPISGPQLYCSKLGDIYSDKDGNFEYLLSKGQYTFNHNKFSNYYRYWNKSSCFTNAVNVTATDSSKNNILEFPLLRSSNINDLASYITPYWGTRARRGFEEPYIVSCRNMGSLKQPAQLYIYLPSNLSNINFDITPDTVKNNYACWLLDTLRPDSQVKIKMTVEFDTTYFHLGDSVYFYSVVLPENNDSFIYDNRDTVKQYIVASHDPNFKSAMPGDSNGNAIIEPGRKELNYTIHFENTGTDTAYNVKIVDVLDTAINPFSIYTTSCSNEYTMSIYKNTLTWKFNNIKLPPKDTLNPNNHASEGYINYRVNLKENYPIGTTIYNIADIYFDYNAPVQTNTSVVLINQTTSPSYVRLPAEYNTFEVYPNPANDKIYISTENLKTISIYNLLGELVYQSNFVLSKPIDISVLAKGLYLLKAENTLGERHIVKFVKE